MGRGPSPEPHLAVTDRTVWQQAESMGCCQVGDEDMVSSPGGMLFQLRGFGRWPAHLMTFVDPATCELVAFYESHFKCCSKRER